MLTFITLLQFFHEMYDLNITSTIISSMIYIYSQEEESKEKKRERYKEHWCYKHWSCFGEI